MRLVRDEALMWLPRPKSTYSVLRSAREELEIGMKGSLHLTFTAILWQHKEHATAASSLWFLLHFNVHWRQLCAWFWS